MSHEMTSLDQMYSVRVAPWHMGMGTNITMLDVAPERRAERIDLAGHAFIVEEHPLYKESAAHPCTFTPVDNWKLITRSDTQDVLHVARDSYTVVQNIVGHQLFEILAEGARLDDGTGGTVKGGAVCYLSARVDEEYMVKGDASPLYPYIVVIWSHDGTGAVQVRRTSVRVVCWNTISLSEAQAKASGRNYTFTHKKNVLERIEEAKRVIAGARDETKAFVELGNELARIPISNQTREDFITEFIPAPATDVVISDRVLDNILMARAQMRQIFSSATISEGIRGSAYELLQGGIEYLDHLRGYNNKDTYLGRTLLRDEPMKKKLVPMIRELVAA